VSFQASSVSSRNQVRNRNDQWAGRRNWRNAQRCQRHLLIVKGAFTVHFLMEQLDNQRNSLLNTGK
jgi:hypothetical protein